MCALSEGVSLPSVERSGADVEVNREAVTLLTTGAKGVQGRSRVADILCAAGSDGEICRIQQTGLQSVAASVFNVLG